MSCLAKNYNSKNSERKFVANIYILKTFCKLPYI